MKLSREQNSTILAALRFYQANNQGDPDSRSAEIHELATGGGEDLTSLDDEGIDDLCEALNCQPEESHGMLETVAELVADLERIGFGGDDDIEGSEAVDVVNDHFESLRGFLDGVKL